MEGRNVGTIEEKGPKQGLTSAEDITIELPYHGLICITHEIRCANKEKSVYSNLKIYYI